MFHDQSLASSAPFSPFHAAPQKKGSESSADCGRRRCNLRPQLSALLRDGTKDGRSLHLTLVVHNDACVILEVDEGTLRPPPSLPLADANCFQHLLTKLGLSLLDRRDEHVTGRRARHLVQAAANSDHSHDEKVLCTAVVRTHDERVRVETD